MGAGSSGKDAAMSEAESGRRPRVVVVGASAGGVEALTRLVRRLPSDFPLPIVVVLHVPPTTSMLPQILSRAGELPAEHARNGARLTAGRIQIAPPDCHVLVADGVVNVGRGPKENGHRPAIDPLFRTAAAQFGPGVIGIVLSGALDDGTAGLAQIKARGGVTVVQEPDEALYPAMPTSARDVVDPHHVLPVTGIVDLLINIARSPLEPEPSQSTRSEKQWNGTRRSLLPGR